MQKQLEVVEYLQNNIKPTDQVFWQVITKEHFFDINKIELTDEEWNIFVDQMQSKFAEYASEWFRFSKSEINEIVNETSIIST